MMILYVIPISLRLWTPNSLGQGTLVVPNVPNITITYAAPMRQLNPISIGMDESGYHTPDVLVNDRLERLRVRTLGIKYMRMHLIYSTPGDPNSTIICGGLGCDHRWTEDQWIQAIEGIGAIPVVEVPSLFVDAVNLVKHFNRNTSHHVRYWIIGNEPDLHGISARTYSAMFNQDYDAMKACDSSIQIGGGTTAWYDQTFLETFLRLSGGRVDFVDFHSYAQQGNVARDPITLLHNVAQYGTDLKHLRALIQSIVPTRSASIGMEVGEWELDWGGDAQNDTYLHIVWVTSVLGHILRAGGEALFYADKGNALYDVAQTIPDGSGHLVNVRLDDPRPAYHGIGMFTGEGLFQGFGKTMVRTSTTLPDVDVFASDHPRNIVVVNKDLSHMRTAVITLQGVTSGTMSVWRKDRSVLFSAPPIKLGTIQVQNGSFTYPLSPLSVTAFVFSLG